MDFFCRGCGSTIESLLLDLGSQPIANRLLAESKDRGEVFPLQVFVCDFCALVQINNELPREVHFNDQYVYYSSYSDSWLLHIQQLVNFTTNLLELSPTDLVIEVASNDGYLLKHYRDKGIKALGIEPASNVARHAIEVNQVNTIVDFFGFLCAINLEAQFGKAKLIIALNVLAHVPDIIDFVKGFESLITDEGLIILEFPHLQNILREVQFDTIYHEHYSYLSLTALIPIFERVGLRIFDAIPVQTHGGSLRIVVCKNDSIYGTKPSVQQILEEEKGLDPRNLSVRRNFQEEVSIVCRDLRKEISNLKKSGSRVVGYGAAAKGNTLLNLAGIGCNDIEYIVDRSPVKQGKFMPGSRIPIRDAKALITDPPDIILILVWNIADEVSNQLRSLGIQVPIFKAIPRIEYLN